MANRFGFKGNIVELNLRMRGIEKMNNFMKQFKFGVSIKPYEKWYAEYDKKMSSIDSYNSIDGFEQDMLAFLEKDIPVELQEWVRG